MIYLDKNQENLYIRVCEFILELGSHFKAKYPMESHTILLM